MVIQCLVTKAMSAYLMEECDLSAILLAFSTHATRFRPPAFILSDAGSNFNVNRRNSLLEKLEPALECEKLPASNQMLNVVESGIKVLKNILATNAFGIETQHPLLNKTQWICLMETIIQFLNIRPIPSQKTGTIGVILNPNRLLKPYLTERDYFTLFENLTNGIFPDDKIFTTILEDNKKLATILSTELKKVLTNDGRLLFNLKRSRK